MVFAIIEKVMIIMKRRWVLPITFVTILWTIYSTIASFFTIGPLEKQSLAQSIPADRTDQNVAAIIRQHIPVNAKTTLLYLNGIDGGDNYYRMRYFLYPIHFIDYWSWQYPNAGGYVWNIPRFSDANSLRHILVEDHVTYLVAVRDPRMMRLLPSKKASWQYIFRVNQHALADDQPLNTVLQQVVAWK